MASSSITPQISTEFSFFYFPAGFRLRHALIVDHRKESNGKSRNDDRQGNTRTWQILYKNTSHHDGRPSPSKRPPPVATTSGKLSPQSLTLSYFFPHSQNASLIFDAYMMTFTKVVKKYINLFCILEKN